MIFVVILSLILGPLVENIFGLDVAQTNLLVWVSRAYLLGLVGHSLLEVISRAYYAQYNAKTPFFFTFLRTVIFIILAITFLNSLGVIGIALADSIAVTFELVILSILLHRKMPGLLRFPDTIFRVAIGCVVSAGVLLAFLTFIPLPMLALVILGGIVSGLIYLPFIGKELKVLVRM